MKEEISEEAKTNTQSEEETSDEEMRAVVEMCLS